jgi:hypothetical protein
MNACLHARTPDGGLRRGKVIVRSRARMTSILEWFDELKPTRALHVAEDEMTQHSMCTLYQKVCFTSFCS